MEILNNESLHKLQQICSSNLKQLGKYIDKKYLKTEDIDVWDNMFEPYVSIDEQDNMFEPYVSIDEQDNGNVYGMAYVSKIEHIEKHDKILFIYGTEVGYDIDLNNKTLILNNPLGVSVRCWCCAFNLLTNLLENTGEDFLYTSGKEEY